ncbi:GNAT family N-acetyltransferase [Candidatus Woesearchaeota archaeon]|nr:GNAT family N-acetyltransferase [Candidatus Woesearchaeota archaeon]
MLVQQKKISSTGVKLFIQQDGKEIARAFLYLIYNDLHTLPYGLMEDVFVDEAYRGSGYGKIIIKELIDEAKKLGCYKLVGFSRYDRENVHKLYLNFGFRDFGKEFRMDF